MRDLITKMKTRVLPDPPFITTCYKFQDNVLTLGIDTNGRPRSLRRIWSFLVCPTSAPLLSHSAEISHSPTPTPVPLPLLSQSHSCPMPTPTRLRFLPRSHSPTPTLTVCHSRARLHQFVRAEPGGTFNWDLLVGILVPCPVIKPAGSNIDTATTSRSEKWSKSLSLLL